MGPHYAGVRIHILDPMTLLPVESGVAGELFVEGDFLAEGFSAQPSVIPLYSSRSVRNSPASNREPVGRRKC